MRQAFNTLRTNNVVVCRSRSGLSKKFSTAVKDKDTRTSTASKQKKFPNKPEFSDKVKECIPTAVQRHVRRKSSKDKWEPIDPKDPKNKIVTLENGEKRIINSKGEMIPLFRDWEKEFGRSKGDSRPYFRKNMGPQLMPYKENPNLEKIESLVVVEGLKDWQRVKTAVDSEVFVCDGAQVLNSSFESYIKNTIKEFDGNVIVLMDPDTAGRRLRMTLDELMAPCKHAFVSEFDAIIGMGTQEESVGIEHATPKTIRHALRTQREYKRDREISITFDMLYDLGLVLTSGSNVRGTRLRRRFVCGLLGIGFCDGKQLMKQLNGFGFTMEELEAAVAKANVLAEEWMHKPWRIQTDYAKPPRQSHTFNIPRNFTSAF